MYDLGRDSEIVVVYAHVRLTLLYEGIREVLGALVTHCAMQGRAHDNNTSSESNPLE